MATLRFESVPASERAEPHRGTQTLMERQSGQFLIRLNWIPIMGDMLTISVQSDTDRYDHTVPNNKGLDAFAHPFVYLNDEQVRRLIG